MIFVIATNRMKYLGTKGVKDLYTGNYETFCKEMEEDTKKQKDISYSWTGRSDTAKMPCAPTPLNANPIQIPTAFS